MSEKIHLIHTIPELDEKQRLDQALAALMSEYSRACLQNWIKSGQVKVNGQVITRPRDKVSGGESIEIHADLDIKVSDQPQKIALNIVYEDESLLVINKPAGLIVHPAAGAPDSTLLNALLYHCPELSSVPRAGIIHRIDKDTTGLLVIAKTLTAHNALVRALQERDIHRTYETIVNGLMTAGGTIEAPIGRHPKNRTKMAVVQSGKPAVTHYRLIHKYRAHTHVRVQLETGRTHQIRVHMAHIHYPIVGDQSYGGRFKAPAGINEALKNQLHTFKRQALHAKQLELIHPQSGELMQWTAPLPGDMQALLNALALDQNDT